MLLTPYASDAQDEKTQAFTKAYEDKYGDTPISLQQMHMMQFTLSKLQ